MSANKIKFCLSLAIILVISVINAIQADQRQRVIDFHAECLSAHGVEEEALVEALDGQVREDEDFYRHLFCAARKAQIMTEDGTVQTENFEITMKDVIDPENMDNVASIVRKCLIQREDIVTTIREAIHCFSKEDHGI